MCVACFTRPCRSADSVFCSDRCVRSVADEVAAGGTDGGKKRRKKTRQPREAGADSAEAP